VKKLTLSYALLNVSYFAYGDNSSSAIDLPI